MGKSKSSRKPPAKPKIILPPTQEFDCPFCNANNSCSVTLDKSTKRGFVMCGNCKINFGTMIHDLYQPIDVYNDWIDSCEDANLT